MAAAVEAGGVLFPVGEASDDTADDATGDAVDDATGETADDATCDATGETADDGLPAESLAGPAPGTWNFFPSRNSFR